MSIQNNAVTLENPTWDFLHNNFRKSELQKHCRDIGITKVWVTKEKLIDQIMEKYRSSRPNIPENVVGGQEVDTHEVMNSVMELRERITIRDTEIDELNELLKTAHVTINKLSDRLSSLEDKVEQLQGTSTQETPREVPSAQSISERTLLLGDNNLGDARASDLNSNCLIRTIRGANIDLIKCWISERLQWVPDNCVLYCGLQDILDGTTPSDIFDRMGSMVACLKEKNEAMNIYICELAPVLRVEDFDENINNFNNQLISWSASNGVSVIKTNLNFRLGTSEIDQMCFDMQGNNEGIFLNRYGIIRLLNAISKQCPPFKLHENWETIIRNIIPSQKYSRKDSNNEIRNSQLSGYELDRNHQNSYLNLRRNNEPPNRNGILRSDVRRTSYPNSTRQQRTGEGNQERQRYNNTNNYQGHHNSSSFSTRWGGPWVDQGMHQPNLPGHRPRPHLPSHRPCHFCGETNHLSSDCRIGYRIKCNVCNEYGHKTRLCNNNL